MFIQKIEEIVSPIYSQAKNAVYSLYDTVTRRSNPQVPIEKNKGLDEYLPPSNGGKNPPKNTKNPT